MQGIGAVGSVEGVEGPTDQEGRSLLAPNRLVLLSCAYRRLLARGPFWFARLNFIYATPPKSEPHPHVSAPLPALPGRALATCRGLPDPDLGVGVWTRDTEARERHRGRSGSWAAA